MFDTLARLSELNRKISDCKRKKRDCEKKIKAYNAAIKKVQKAENDNDDAMAKEKEIAGFKETLTDMILDAAKGDAQYSDGFGRGLIPIKPYYPVNTINMECEEAVRYWSNKIVQQNNKISSYNIQIRNYEYERSLL